MDPAGFETAAPPKSMVQQLPAKLGFGMAVRFSPTVATEKKPSPWGIREISSAAKAA